jgi:hypothetical protein
MININNEAMISLVNTIVLNRIFNNIDTSYLHNFGNRMSFLQRKRGFDYNCANYSNQNIDQKNNHSNISNIDMNKCNDSFNANIKQFKSGQELRSDFIKHKKYNINKIPLNNYSFNYSNFCQNKENNDENLNSNSIINNFNYKLNKNKIYDSQDNKPDIQKLEEHSNDHNNSTDVSNTPFPSINAISSESSKKSCYFKIIHNNNEKIKRRKKRKIIKQTENNNEIKVLKNNKVVYVNNFLLNSYSTSKNIKELNTIAFVERNKRSSRFRGVSKNGNQWQVLMMINKNKSYIGSYDSEEFAARIYDVLAIKNRGMNARTNFKYNSKQIKNICEKDIDIKSKNINEIISQLIV